MKEGDIKEYQRLKRQFFKGKDPEIITLEGRLDSNNADIFGEHVRDVAFATGNRKIAVEASGLTYASSAGWAEIIELNKEFKRWNRGRLVLVDVDERIANALHDSGIALRNTDGNLVGNYGVEVFLSKKQEVK